MNINDDKDYSLRNGVKTCIQSMLTECNGHCCSVSSDDYWKKVYKYKHLIMEFLPVGDICIKHSHNDTYVHFSHISNLKNIISNGYLTSDRSSEDNTLGKAIYTYPLKSGMFFYQEYKVNFAFLVFEAEAEHHHIVQTDDSPYGIGEADFFVDKLKIENPRILSYEEMEKLSREMFDWELAKKHYYGLDVPDKADYDSFYEVIEKYN